MTELTAADVRQAFAEKGCWHIVGLLDYLATIPRDQIKMPFGIAFIYPGSDAKSIQFDDLLTPSKLMAQKRDRPKSQVRSLAHLKMLLDSISAKHLHGVDSSIKTFDTKQFTT